MAKVLVIDDDAQLLRMVGMILERGGHEPLLLDDPRKGIERIREEEPDLLILDVMMPDVSGHALTEQIRATKEISQLPILILTARSQNIDRQAALESGANDYMSKPVIPQELMERIDNLLTQPPMAHMGMTVSLFGFRGGCGRTTLAVNLAAALRRLSGEEVCLVDLTPSGGQATIHLRLQARRSWADLTMAQLDWPALKDSLLIHQSGLRVLAAPREPQLPIAPSGELTLAALQLLRKNVLFTIVDLPPIINPAAQAALSNSDLVLHIVRPEVVSIQLALQAARALRRDEITLQHQSFILNQVVPEPQLPQAAVLKGLKSRPAFTVGHDPNQVRALAQGVPLTLTKAETVLPTTIRRLASSIWERRPKQMETAA